MIRLSRGLLAVSRTPLAGQPADALAGCLTGVRFAASDRGKKLGDDELVKPAAAGGQPGERPAEPSAESPTDCAADAGDGVDAADARIRLQAPAKSRRFVEVNLFGPKDARAPLPGNVGTAPAKYDRRRTAPAAAAGAAPPEFRLIAEHADEERAGRLTSTVEQQLYRFESTGDRQSRVLENLAYVQSVQFDLARQFAAIRPLLDVRVFDCPRLVAGDLQQMFISRSLERLAVRMITISRRRPATSAADDLPARAGELIEQLCEQLEKAGYWSDHVGPEETGMDMEDGYLSASAVETSERYKRSAFRVQTLNDCKLINHPPGEDRLFLGSIFTNAGLDAKPLRILLAPLVNAPDDV